MIKRTQHEKELEKQVKELKKEKIVVATNDKVTGFWSMINWFFHHPKVSIPLVIIATFLLCSKVSYINKQWRFRFDPLNTIAVIEDKDEGTNYIINVNRTKTRHIEINNFITGKKVSIPENKYDEYLKEKK